MKTGKCLKTLPAPPDPRLGRESAAAPTAEAVLGDLCPGVGGGGACMGSHGAGRGPALRGLAVQVLTAGVASVVWR